MKRLTYDQLIEALSSPLPFDEAVEALFSEDVTLPDYLTAARHKEIAEFVLSMGGKGMPEAEDSVTREEVLALIKHASKMPGGMDETGVLKKQMEQVQCENNNAVNELRIAIHKRIGKYDEKINKALSRIQALSLRVSNLEQALIVISGKDNG